MDFLFLHIYKYNKPLGEKMVTSVPEDVIDFLTCHKLDFYKKINPKSLRNIPDDINMNFFLDTLYKCGINIYNSEDFKELYETRSLLAKYYNEDNKNIKIGNM